MIKPQLNILIASILLASCFAQLSFPITKVQRKQDGSRFLQSKLSVVNSYNNVYILQIYVGSKSQTQINVQLDTGSYVLWFASKSCAGCEGHYPNRYNCQVSDGCVLSSQQDELTFGDGTDVTGTIGQVFVQLADGTTINKQYFNYITSGKDIVSGQEDGIFGLGPLDNYNSAGKYQNWVNILFANKVISANQFSLYLDNCGNNTQTVNSRLMLGTLDSSYLQPNTPINTIPVTSTQQWTISSQKVSFGGKVISNSPVDVLIDSGTSFMALPKNMFNAVKSVLSNTYSIQYDSNQGGFVGACGQRLPTFTFYFDDINNNQVTYTLEPEFYALYDSSSQQCAFLVSQEDSLIILGDVFIMKYVPTFIYTPYLLIQLGLSITQPNQIPFLPSPPSDNSFPLWAKIVIPVAGCIVIAAIIYYFYSRAKSQKLAKQQQQQNQQFQPQQYQQQQQQQQQQHQYPYPPFVVQNGQQVQYPYQQQQQQQQYYR
ncbi:hypothetical protein ABPG74_006140 [Tetrahymena malaccensis]